MASDVYKTRIKTAGFEVMSGERELQSFTDMVAAVDEDLESKKSETVKTDQPAATTGEGSQTPEEIAKGLTAANAKSLSEDINNTSQVI